MINSYSEEEIESSLLAYADERYEDILVPLRILKQTYPEEIRTINKINTRKDYMQTDKYKQSSKKYHRKYYLEHKDTIKAYHKIYYLEHLEERLVYGKRWRQENKDEVNARARENYKKRKLEAKSNGIC